MAVDLFAELGFDPDDPEVVAAREDAAELTDLIERLVSLRKELRVRQADVAVQMGTTQSAVSDFERLGADPRVTTVQRYARAIGARIRIDVDASRCWDGAWRRLAYRTGEAPAWTAAPDQERWPVSNDGFALAA